MKYYFLTVETFEGIKLLEFNQHVRRYLSEEQARKIGKDMKYVVKDVIELDLDNMSVKNLGKV